MRTDINVYAEIIDERVIEDCEINGACDSGLSWLRAMPRTLEQLRDYKLDWFRWLAQYTTVPALLEKLSADSDNDMRKGVAQNAHTPVKVLEKLSADSYYGVRWGVAQNAHTPAKVLEKLSADSDNDVRREVAQNAHTPVKVLEKLSADSDNVVRKCVAQNAHTPVKVLEKLSDDSDNNVRWEAKKNKANRRDCLGKTREA